jgi:hypothetical protein
MLGWLHIASSDAICKARMPSLTGPTKRWGDDTNGDTFGHVQLDITNIGAHFFVFGANFARGAEGALVADLVSDRWDTQLPAPRGS